MNIIMKHVTAVFASLCLLLGLTIAAPPAAFASATNVCHVVGFGIDKPITIQAAVDEGSAIILLQRGQCSVDRGMHDAQNFFVPEGKKVKTYVYNGSGFVLLQVVPASPYWRRILAYCYDPCYMSYHNA